MTGVMEAFQRLNPMRLPGRYRRRQIAGFLEASPRVLPVLRQRFEREANARKQTQPFRRQDCAASKPNRDLRHRPDRTCQWLRFTLAHRVSVQAPHQRSQPRTLKAARANILNKPLIRHWGGEPIATGAAIDISPPEPTVTHQTTEPISRIPRSDIPNGSTRRHRHR